MDYQSSVQLLKYLLTDYLHGYRDEYLAESARKTVTLILERLVRPVFVIPDFKKDENFELAKEQLLELCQKRNFEPLVPMRAEEKELLMYYMTKQLIHSKRYDQLSGLCETFDYKELVQSSLTEERFPKAPWCARLYWLLAAHYTHKLPLHELRAEFDRVGEEIKPVAGKSIEIDKAYLIARCSLSTLYESADNENAMDEVSQLIAELESCSDAVLRPSPYKELLLASVWKSKVKMLLDRRQLKEADDLLKKVSETETKNKVSPAKTEVLKTRLKRLNICDQPKDLKEIEMIQQGDSQTQTVW